MGINKLRKTKQPSGGIWTSIFNSAEKVQKTVKRARKTVKKVSKMSLLPKNGPDGVVTKKRKTAKRKTSR